MSSTIRQSEKYIQGKKMITILITHNINAQPAAKTGDTPSGIEEPRTLLLREGLRSMGMAAYAELFTPDMLEHTEDGKPYIPDLSHVHFNLSHSGDYIACAFSDEEVGLDLQEHCRTHTSIVRIARRFFSVKEYEAILALPAEDSSDGPGHPINTADPDNSASRLPLFYRFWSIKEAYLKYLGCGLRGGMNGFYPDPLPDSGDELTRGQIHVTSNDPLLAPGEYALAQAPENYTMAVCAAELPEKITVKVI